MRVLILLMFMILMCGCMQHVVVDTNHNITINGNIDVNLNANIK